MLFRSAHATTPSLSPPALTLPCRGGKGAGGVRAAQPRERPFVTEQEKVDILLVDDQPAELLSYEVILDPLGENLVKPGSTGEALEQLLKRNVAIILIDVCTPDLELPARHYDPRASSLSAATSIL